MCWAFFMHLCAMLDFAKPNKVTITCHKFLSESLAKEVKDLGFTIEEVFPTGLQLSASLNDCIKLNLNLHCASQVLYQLCSFSAGGTDAIYAAVREVDWTEILPEDAHFSITSNVWHPSINNSMFANLRVKDAIVDQVREKTGRRPSTGAELSGTVIHLFWKDDAALLFLDTTGASIARHGYRKIPGQAPMLEALAAATVLATNWDHESPFVNPMCGSGTLAIEAALLATKRRPGLFRNQYAFMHIKGYDASVYAQEDALLEAQIIDRPQLKIIASDIQRQAIVNAQKNAVAGGVKELITFELCDFEKTTVPPEAQGLVFLNPEYGERLGQMEELEEQYQRIGNFFKQKCAGYTGYVFTGNPDLAKKIGLRSRRKIPFYNAKIECRLLEFELFAGARKERFRH